MGSHLSVRLVTTMMVNLHSHSCLMVLVYTTAGFVSALPGSTSWTNNISTTTPTTTPPTPPPAKAPPYIHCGVNARDPRIIGGTVATQGKWPWAVALGTYQEGDGFHVHCGGTLINEDTVLTAAICTRATHVRLGDHDVTNPVYAVFIRIDNMIPHPQYNSISQANDIAIGKLSRSVDYNRNISPACLPYSYGGQNLASLLVNPSPIVIGWGRTQPGGETSNVLRQANVPVVPQQECKNNYASFSTAVIDDTTICAGRGVRDACQGDSGGPLLSRKLQGGRWAVVGVTSWGKGCAKENFPGVYTRVDKYVDWIRQHM